MPDCVKNVISRDNYKNSFDVEFGNKMAVFNFIKNFKEFKINGRKVCIRTSLRNQ